MTKILTALIFIFTSAPAFAGGLLEDAQSIETLMNNTPPAIVSSDAKSINRVTPEEAQRQITVTDAVTDLTTAAVKAKSIDAKTFEAICHVIARNGLYDQMGESVDPKFTKKYRARIDQVFTKFQNERVPYEKGRKFDEGRMDQVRIQLDMAVSAQEQGEKQKPGKRTNKNLNDDGAALSPCDTGGALCPATSIPTLAPPAKRSLIRLPSTATGPSTAARN